MTTVQMIERQVNMARLIGRDIATPTQARQIQKIGVSYQTTEETLATLGLPPNRDQGQRGFLVLHTDGKLKEAVHGSSDGHPVA